MKVLPMYLFLIKPSLKGIPNLEDNSNAEILLVSGIGTTTSISLSGRAFLILSASAVPMFILALYTEIPSMMESGLAK